MDKSARNKIAQAMPILSGQANMRLRAEYQLMRDRVLAELGEPRRQEQMALDQKLELVEFAIKLRKQGLARISQFLHEDKKRT